MMLLHEDAPAALHGSLAQHIRQQMQRVTCKAVIRCAMSNVAEGLTTAISCYQFQAPLYRSRHLDSPR